MKILWFTNTPCSAAEKMGQEGHRGGWLKSLEQAIHRQPDIELHIAFYSGKKMQPFEYKSTFFYPLHRKNTGSKAARYINKLLHRGAKDTEEVNQLLTVVDAVKPDLIHIHGTEDNFGLLQQHTSIPVVISIQGALLPYADKFFSGIPASIARKYEGMLPKLKLQSAAWNYHDMRKRAVREQTILSMAKHVIGRTDWDRRVTRVLAPGSAYYLNNEIMRAPFYETRWRKSGFNTTLRIITISSDSLYKGFEHLVQTARLLSNSDLSFEWQVIGLDKHSTIVKTALQWLKADPASLHIKLLGSKNEQEIVQLLSEADVYCQVSHIENSPNSLCEALLLGMPVIATYAGGTASLLQDHREGLLVQDGDPYSLAGALAETAGSFNKARQMAEHARQRALERHDPERISGDLAGIYQQIIQRANTVPITKTHLILER